MILFWMVMGIILWQAITLTVYVFTQNKKTALLVGFSIVYAATYGLVKLIQFFERTFSLGRRNKC